MTTLWQVESHFLQRILQTPNAPAGLVIHTEGQTYNPADIVLYSTLSDVDWSDPDNSPVLGMQIMFAGHAPSDQAGFSSLLNERWTIDIYLDRGRETAAHRTACAALVETVIRAACGWDPRPGLGAELAPGDPFGIEKRGARISLAIHTPVIYTGY